jgi:peptidoglycan hydrolase-like protein with peptidoglycan-binding domain
MKKIKNILAVVGATFFATVMFATVNAATSTATVTAVGAATSSMVNVTRPVVVAATSSCPNLINTYNKIGSYGTEVAKLQNFLNSVNGANLNGQGYFGPVTQQEVKNFQYTYGIKPTGYQHVLTTKMINDINCGKVVKKVRKVYMLSSAYTMKSPVMSAAASMGTVSNSGANLVKEYQAPTKINLVGTGTTATVTMATKTSFWENLNKDWNKIKENYKAYLLVFALVLALFWFLRKAATE